MNTTYASRLLLLSLKEHENLNSFDLNRIRFQVNKLCGWNEIHSVQWTLVNIYAAIAKFSKKENNPAKRVFVYLKLIVEMFMLKQTHRFQMLPAIKLIEWAGLSGIYHELGKLFLVFRVIMADAESEKIWFSLVICVWFAASLIGNLR